MRAESPEHGGRVRAASARYGIPLNDWLDLSTGINPQSWPAPPMPRDVWTRLPEDDDGLERAAAEYYGSTALLPVPGSQAAIQILPRLRKQSRVGVIMPGYSEHARAWRDAGHDVRMLTDVQADLAELDVLVVVQPNNPTGACFAPEQLQHWAAQLAARDGWLVVDEAFLDATPNRSLIAPRAQAGVIVLRSLGKFFGLAGARVGFVHASHEILNRARVALGPWALAHPSRWIAAQALADRTWQEQARRDLPAAAVRLAALLARHGLAPRGGCALFQWVRTADAAELHVALARRGILTRLFETPASLRFGLPGTEIQWARLDQALSVVRRVAA